MEILAPILVAAGAFVIIYLLLLAAIAMRCPQPRVVRCPATGDLVVIEIGGAHTVRSVLTATPSLRVRHCSLWPARSGCGEACIGKLAAAPQDSTLP